MDLDRYCNIPQIWNLHSIGDLFSVFLALKTVLVLVPPEDVTVKLKHAGGALKFVYTDLEPSRVGDFLKKEGMEGTINHDTYGPAFNQALRNATTETITAAGVELNAAVLKKIRDSGKTETQGEGGTQTTITNPAKGVILLEGTGFTEAPLIVEILKGAEVIGEIKLPLKLSGVEDMYRWANFRATCNEAEARASDLGVPSNYPDELTNGKTLVFLHGYNVPEVRARGWCAEVFKRLHQCGSRAKFAGVVWRSEEGAPIRYYKNLVHAFEIAPALRSTIAGLPGEKHLMAHSLGNIAASSAIVDWNASVANYYAVNAAIAMESFDASLENNGFMRDAMCHPPWKEYDSGAPVNPRRLWSSEWYKLFEDDRHELTWRGRFGPIAHMWNYHSTGDEVTGNDVEGVRSAPEGGFSGVRSWAAQEKSKSRGITAVWPGVASHGGWGMNTNMNAWASGPATLFTYPDDHFRVIPVFVPFDVPGIHSKQYIDGVRKNFPIDKPTRAHLLAEAIPALSFATGANPLNPLNSTQRNIDMMSFRNTRPGVAPTLPDGSPNPDALIWPRPGDDDMPCPWFHSDCRDVAYYFTWKFYESIVNLGNFKE